MAELVAGAFLQSSFQVIIEKLASVGIRDYFSSNNVDELVKELNIALDSINQVLDEAEIKQYQNKYVKKWLDELKHVVYEADQLLDEISTDAMINKLNAESEPLTTNLLGLVSALTTNPFECRLNEQLDKLELLAKQKKDLRLGEGPSASNEGLVSWKPSKRLSSTALVDESSIYGRDVDKEKLIKFLLEGNDSGNQVPIISIVGLGGMGKTTLAKLVYNDNKIKKHFELKAWVYVSESFDVFGLTKAILKSFNPSADGEDLNQLQHQLQHMLMGKKYLLVLDDIWNGSVEYWEQLLLPFNHGSSGSKIIVTTREKEVACHVLKSTELFDLQQLEKSNCWRLFVTHAFQGKSVCEYPNLETIGKKIVDKCGGLPLAIKSLAQLLRRKFSEHEWIKILETDMWRLSDGDHTINSVLRLSYHNLPSDLRRCFSYCSIFPKGYRFEKEVLIKLWMGEGLLKCCGSDKSEEEFGNEIFGDLESISFFQQSFDPYEHYVMHDLVNDLTKSVSGEFCLQIEGARVEGINERTRHIQFSFPSHCDDDFLLKNPNGVDNLLEPICELKGLRSLMILQGMRASMDITNNVQHGLFSRLKCLRMLTFRGCYLSELVDEISNLKLLRYLDLSYTKIRSLPDTICMLYNLQTLLLKGCRQLTELPSNFSKLINLRHLELPCIKKMPKNMGKLNNLQTLSYFIVEAHNESDLKDLAKLNHLHGTIHIKGLGNVSDPADAATSNLKDKKYLEEFQMEFNGGREEMDERSVLVLEALQPNSNLKKLNITCYKGSSFPNWLRGSHLPNLVSLQLKGCGLCSCLPALGQLPSLKKLSIYDCEGIKIIDEEFYGNNSTIVPFKSLEYLRFVDMVNWEEWICVRFPLLKELYIENCPKLKSTLPQHLPSLQKLIIYGCKELEEWLCLEGFLSLKELSIWYCSKFKRVLPQHLPSLLNLRINYCNELEEWLCLGEFPLLNEFSISNCPELKRALPQHLPSLQKLFINDCNKLEASIPKCDNMIELDIQSCDRILVNELPTSLKSLLLWQNRYTEFSVDQNLINFPFLESLQLDFTGFVECPSLDLRCYNSLWRLSIQGWHSSSLPLELHLFTNLNYLYLYDCPELESFPMGGLPSNLGSLQIYNCPKLIGSREEWGLFQLNSLKSFFVTDEFENVESFPEENLLPPTLETLVLNKCSKLRKMNNKGFLHLKSLNWLSILDCPSLESLPEKEALPNSLSELNIRNCGIIKEKYEKEGGELWHTISHIPNVCIDNIKQE
ncbi:putative P-loop containing nucleoside triphosphate hydrolase, leucine-rich repeat domain, L [Medicago truncatula]|uniref:Putative P-loop containing nucleoside triphosphate hydrolase, leucine-rich repeat domain, L n=1 Tax=Medicago truncatula TaxID=3880 RepID=A0A396IJT6_MEDTR|nr:putative disease resistance protein At3g14460 [Medicago truncatula]XP_024630029.2 putative disease resistance protein At3g14460 [Medicago truncatula]XP_024630030.2 putative disease resistance protein At3g14460 [Medicago truncatula]RHN65936.1 putative P-loop containing nucleoside triphosphate hydrolase, leucine-rich repeat domain, L [Medicago truncatula]